MKYLGVLLAGILIVAWVPGSAAAQGFPSPIGVGLPSLGGSWGGGGCAPLCDPKVGGGVDFWVGYLTTNRSIALDLESNDVGIAGRLQHRYGLSGLWLALSASGEIGDGVGLFARGSWLVPSNEPSDEAYNSLVVASRTWGTRVQWYNADIAATFSPYGAFSLIGGFRFDSFATTFTNPSNAIGIISLGTDEADMTVTSYIPYVGAMVKQGSAVKVGLIGFPYVPGSVKYNQTIFGAVRVDTSGSFRNSYFLEAFAEYGMQIGGGSVGIFGIWTYLHGSSDVDLALQGFAALPQTLQYTFDRQNWIFGGKFGINFTSPM